MKTPSCGQWSHDQKNDGSPEHPTELSCVRCREEVLAFQQAMQSWMERDYLKVLTGGVRSADIGRLGKRDVLAPLTFAVRSDRFCEGSLKNLVDSGFISRCLR